MSSSKVYKGRNIPPVSGGTPSIQLVKLGSWGNSEQGISIVRLISNNALKVPQLASEAITAATSYMEEFGARLLITAGGFGYVTIELHSSEDVAIKAVQDYITYFLQHIPRKRNFDIILGVDCGPDWKGQLQDAYFIPNTASSIGDCTRVHKSYPTLAENYLFTQGRPCPGRAIDINGKITSLLICSDLTAFSGRSVETRGQQKENWAEQLEDEVLSGSSGVVHLIHRLDTYRAGGGFKDGMNKLVSGKSSVAWVISAFRTSLNATSSLDADELKKIEKWTSRFAGPTLDLYVQETPS